MKMAVGDEDSVALRIRRAGPAVKSGKGVKLQKTITVNRPVSDVFSFLRHLENLPRFMKHLESVRCNGGNISHWVAEIGGLKLEWDAEAIELRQNEVISWQSLPAAQVDNAGSIWFRPAVGNRGTVVKVALKYAPPGGKAGAKVAKVLGAEAKSAMEDDLRRFKSLIETGEIPLTNGQPKSPQVDR